MKPRIVLGLSIFVLLIVGITIGPRQSRAQTTSLEAAQAAVAKSGAQSVDALNDALDRVSSGQDKRVLERAKAEVLKFQQRAAKGLARAKRGLIPKEDGLAIASEATQKQYAILDGLQHRLPTAAQNGIKRAIEASKHGHYTVSAIRGGQRPGGVGSPGSRGGNVTGSGRSLGPPSGTTPGYSQDRGRGRGIVSGSGRPVGKGGGFSGRGSSRRGKGR